MHLPSRVTAGLCALIAASTAWAQVRPEPSQHHHHGDHARAATGHSRATPRRPPSLSMGYANGGRLQHPAQLTEDDVIRYMPGRYLHYGTDELIGLIRRSARTVFRRYHTALTVGDLSASRGGPALHHASHQSGRDADLAFYVLDRAGHSVRLSDYVGFRGDGHAMVGESLRFDTSRNWALVEALITDPEIHVEHIFVSNPIRGLLLAHARATGESPGTIARAETAMHQPVHGSPHANHFHVRIACPAGDAACVEGLRPPPRRRRPRNVARGDRHHGHHHQHRD